MKKRLGSTLLALAMVLTLLPWSALSARAEGEAETKIALAFGLNGVANGDTVWFGKKDQNPIAWRVLSALGETTHNGMDLSGTSGAAVVLLLAKYTLGTTVFDAGGDHDWETSDALDWCTALYNDWQNAAEKAAIDRTYVQESGNYIGGHGNDTFNPAPVEPPENAGGNFFFLSAKEADYYFSGDADRKAYASAADEAANTDRNNTGTWWWLRSPRNAPNYMSAVVEKGGWVWAGTVTDAYGARPAFNLKPNDVLFASAVGMKSGVTSTFAPLSGNETHEWELTLRDQDHNEFTVQSAPKAAELGGTVEIGYSCVPSSGEYVSALLCDETGAAVAYGSVSVTSANGTATFTVPQDFPTGRYSMLVFNERRNDDTSDSASGFHTYTLNIAEALGAADAAYEIDGSTDAEAWSNLKAALASNGKERTDGESAEKPTYFKLDCSCTDGTRDDNSYIEVGENRNVVLDLNGKTIDRGFKDASSYQTRGVIRLASGAALTVTDGTATEDNPAGDGAITGGYTYTGGGILVAGGQKAATLTLCGGTVTGNRAYQGGGVYVDNGTVILRGGVIAENKADEGGGIYNKGGCEIENGTISGNTALRGGGIYGESPLTIKGGEITFNTASRGGGVFTEAACTMMGGAIRINTAKCGAGVYHTSFQFTLSGGEIKNNVILDDDSVRNGGGIWSSGRLTLNGGEVSGNIADNGGGVYANENCILTVEAGGRIVGNTAFNSGGGVYKFSSNRDEDGLLREFIMTGGEIAGNQAGAGGGVYLNNGTVTMTGGRIVGNNANREGGGVYFTREMAVENAAFNISGSPVIAGNASGGRISEGVLTGGVRSNVHLRRSSTNSVYNSTRLTVVGELTDGALIGVSVPKEVADSYPAVADAAADYRGGKLTAADLAHFTSDYADYALGPLEDGGVMKAGFFPAALGEDAVTARRGSALLLAQYDASGKMTALQSRTLTADVVDASPASLGIALPKGTRYRLMLVDKTTYAPLCAAWDSANA